MASHWGVCPFQKKSQSSSRWLHYPTYIELRHLTRSIVVLSFTFPPFKHVSHVALCSTIIPSNGIKNSYMQTLKPFLLISTCQSTNLIMCILDCVKVARFSNETKLYGVLWGGRVEVVVGRKIHGTKPTNQLTSTANVDNVMAALYTSKELHTGCFWWLAKWSFNYDKNTLTLESHWQLYAKCHVHSSNNYA